MALTAGAARLHNIQHHVGVSIGWVISKTSSTHIVRKAKKSYFLNQPNAKPILL
jgi:hypothetical protein